MNIEKLKLLEEYIHQGPSSVASRPLPLDTIEMLEAEYCAPGKQFQKVLREFLFLTGGFCSYFSSGVGRPPNYKSDQEISELEFSRETYTFSFPNIWTFGVQQDTQQFYFIDLNQDKDDPDMYYTYTSLNRHDTGISSEHVKKTQYTLSSYIEAQIQHFLDTGSPIGYGW